MNASTAQLAAIATFFNLQGMCPSGINEILCLFAVSRVNRWTIITHRFAYRMEWYTRKKFVSLQSSLMYQGIEILVKQGTGKNTLTCPRTGETFSVKDCEKVYVS